MKQQLQWSLTSILFLVSFFSVQAQTLNETSGTGSGVSITSGDFNTFYGDSTGSFITSGSRTTLFGYSAGRSVTTSELTAIGYLAGYSNTTGFDNTFIGYEAGRLVVNGGDNTFVGTESGENVTTGYDNTFVGEESGTNTTTGYENTFIGEDAGFSNTTGYRNTFIGNEAGISSDVGYRNTGVGDESLSDVDDGHHNTALGDSSGIDIGDGIYNTAVGAASGVATEWADFNTFVGAMSGWDNNRTNSTTNANRNTYVGMLSGASNREGEDNAGLGAFSGYGRAGSVLSSGDFTDFNGNTIRSRTTFFGSQAIAAQNDVITMGYYSYNEGQYAIGIGNLGDMQNAIGAIGIGYQFDTTDNSDYSIGLGYQANIAQSNAVGIGRSVDIDNTEAIAIGANTVAQNDGAIVIGTGAASNDVIDNSGGDPDATNNIAIGYNAIVSGDNAIVIGNAATAATANTMVLGGATNPVSVGVGTDSPSSNASLDLTGTNKGLLINRMTTAQRTSLESSLTAADEGMMVYDNELKTLQTWDGTQWNSTVADDLGNHTATTNLDLAQNNVTEVTYLNFDNVEGNGVRFWNGNNNYKISAGNSTEYQYGPVNDFSIKNSMSNTTGRGWTWGVNGQTPIAAMDITGKLQIANGLNIAGVYEFPIVDGTSAQVLTTDGSGALTWATQMDNQELSLATNTLSISGGTGTVDLSGYLDNTDTQDLDLSGNTLSLTNDGTTVDLSGYLDNTDAQGLSLTTNTLSISGDTGTIDLSGYLDNTDAQDLNLSGNTLSLTNDGTTVDLSGYLDNTDAQDLSLFGNTLSLTNDGTSVDLSGYANTDNQELSLSGNTLSLSGGTSTVDLSAFVSTDNQDITGATLSGNDLTIQIENGASATVDLSPLISTLQSDLNAAEAEVATLQTQMTDVLDRLQTIEACACSGTLGVENIPEGKDNKAILYQNIPNPFNGTSSIKYYLPLGVSKAAMVFSDTSGKVISNLTLNDRGDGEMNINSDGLAAGVYYYTLYVAGQKVDTKRMVIE